MRGFICERQALTPSVNYNSTLFKSVIHTGFKPQFWELKELNDAIYESTRVPSVKWAFRTRLKKQKNDLRASTEHLQLIENGNDRHRGAGVLPGSREAELHTEWPPGGRDPMLWYSAKTETCISSQTVKTCRTSHKASLQHIDFLRSQSLHLTVWVPHSHIKTTNCCCEKHWTWRHFCCFKTPENTSERHH